MENKILKSFLVLISVFILFLVGLYFSPPKNAYAREDPGCGYCERTVNQRVCDNPCVEWNTEDYVCGTYQHCYHDPDEGRVCEDLDKYCTRNTSCARHEQSCWTEPSCEHIPGCGEPQPTNLPPPTEPPPPSQCGHLNEVIEGTNIPCCDGLTELNGICVRSGQSCASVGQPPSAGYENRCCDPLIEFAGTCTSPLPTNPPPPPTRPVCTTSCNLFGCYGGTDLGNDFSNCNGVWHCCTAANMPTPPYPSLVPSTPPPPTLIPTDVPNCGGWGAQCWGGGSSDTCCHSQGLSCQSIDGSRGYGCWGGGPIPTTTPAGFSCVFNGCGPEAGCPSGQICMLSEWTGYYCQESYACGYPTPTQIPTPACSLHAGDRCSGFPGECCPPTSCGSVQSDGTKRCETPPAKNVCPAEGNCNIRCWESTEREIYNVSNCPGWAICCVPKDWNPTPTSACPQYSNPICPPNGEHTARCENGVWRCPPVGGLPTSTPVPSVYPAPPTSTPVPGVPTITPTPRIGGGCISDGNKWDGSTPCCSECLKDNWCRASSSCGVQPPAPSNTPGGPSPTAGQGLIIRGWVWYDTNQNKSKQSEEKVIVDTGLILVDPDWKDIGVGHTSSNIGDKDKNYEFTNAKPGNYNIRYQLPDLTGEKSLEPCASLIPPSPIPSDNRYFYCQDGSLVKLKQWTPNAVNPYKEVSYFTATTGIVNVDFPFISCPLKKYGDANCDGKGDGIDYSIWLNSQCNPGAGQTCNNLQADFNGDGKVDDDDYKIWFDNRGT